MARSRIGRSGMLDDRVVAGCDVVAVEGARLFPKAAELEFFVTHHTGIRRPAGLVFARKIIDHDALELVRLVHHVMRNA